MGKPWLANFNSGQLVIANQVGIRPLGQVYGCCVEKVSMLYFPIATSEVVVEAQAFDEMLTKCQAHLREEASRLGANAVFGCLIEWKRVDDLFPPNDATYFVSSLKITGTAVWDPSAPSNEVLLATADLPGVFALRKADYLPAGLAVGKCTFYQVAWQQSPNTTGFLGTWANEEVVELTRGPYAAREIAMGRMSEMARSYGAVGIVGVSVATEVIPQGSLQSMGMAATCRFLCVGTAIRRKPGPAETISPIALVPLK
jgi:uncharacterized protein YbjQ (UPF0145 family)